MQRDQCVLLTATLLGSWLGMQVIHECGHVLGAWVTGGEVTRVVLHPLTISRTDVGTNPRPLLVVWAGPLFGVAAPLAGWLLGFLAGMPGAYLLRFFAGFCLIANGAYIGAGVVDPVGDAAEMLRLGTPPWLLGLFGAATVPAGLWLWHRQGEHFGLGKARGHVSRRAACVTLTALVLLAALEFLLSAW